LMRSPVDTTGPGRVGAWDWMIGRTSTDLRRASAVLVVAVLTGAGCGSATGQAAQTSTAAQAASTGTTTGSRSAGTGSTPSGGAGRSGIAGQAVAVVCGGASSGAQGCPHRPVLATIAVLRMPSARLIATVGTDSRGRFRLNVPPGKYELRAHTPSHLIWARVVTTRVLPHQIRRTIVTFVPRHPPPIVPGAASG